MTHAFASIIERGSTVSIRIDDEFVSRGFVLLNVVDVYRDGEPLSTECIGIVIVDSLSENDHREMLRLLVDLREGQSERVDVSLPFSVLMMEAGVLADTPQSRRVVRIDRERARKERREQS